MSGRFSRLGRRDALGINEVWAYQRADQADPLLYQIDRRAMQFQFVATVEIPPQVESTAVEDQRTGLIYPRADSRHDPFAIQLSRSARLRSAFRARLTAAACSRARFSDGFS